MNEVMVLIVDDEEDMRNLIRMYLENSRLHCEEASNAKEALQKIETSVVDIVLLDIMMPEVDGFELCEKIRESSNIPIIFLTAKGEEWDRVRGLKAGADDYVVKPFSPGELVARIDAVLRRVNRSPFREGDFEKYGILEVDSKGRQVKVSGQPVTLTLKEFDLLHYFIRHVNQVISRDILLETIWGYDYEGSTRTVDTHIKTLRIKLGEAGSCIQTVWGVGYKFEVS
ncbi:DNA-binding response regulator [Bacillus sp. HMF5848]|uniref:response regulator transcription factor n=1 Tax=Bacillus sp. HMF5848 TaxID=2495421 RepID=UPI000F769B23|nr:response regulator transcription factor [Bacillus sp. HMF5848]RSK28397.1 DNA-binding response regulator [Bacillus sp. HMF5848]